jgi:medium-chain acyl-[acyl-carrier-protein] hydrolase
VAPEYVTLWAAIPGGREERLREPPPADWTRLITELTDQLPARSPFVLFGHCLGALIAFEVTRELRRRGQPQPERLLLVGPGPSRGGGPSPPVDVVATVRETGAVAESVLADRELFAMVAPTIAADLRLAAAYPYRAERRLDIPVDVFVVRECGPADMAAALAWSNETTRPVRAVPIDGAPLFPHGAWLPLANQVFGVAPGRAGVKAMSHG